MSRTHRKLTALIAAAALLFSALSPAMAAVLFSGRPDVLAHMLALPAEQLPVAGEDASHCHDTAGGVQHDAAAHADGDGSEHAAHGIFCSFCLAAAATVTLTGVSQIVIAVVASVAAPQFIPPREPVVARLPSTHRSRAPPVYA